MRFERCFVTGCDENTEWMLRWFLEHYHIHNTTPIVFCDFGVSPECLEWAQRHFDEVIPYSDFKRMAERVQGPRWWLKPLALILPEAGKKVWIDTDCEILGNISGIFDLLQPDKLNMVEDIPWSNRRRELWHNSGVVGVMGNPRILHEWFNACLKESGGYTFGALQRGDQDALHDFVGQDRMKRWIYINDLPNKYNWLRVQLSDGHDSPDKLIVHWTGRKGKEVIREKING